MAALHCPLAHGPRHAGMFHRGSDFLLVTVHSSLVTAFCPLPHGRGSDSNLDGIPAGGLLHFLQMRFWQIRLGTGVVGLALRRLGSGGLAVLLGLGLRQLPAQESSQELAQELAPKLENTPVLAIRHQPEFPPEAALEPAALAQIVTQ